MKVGPHCNQVLSASIIVLLKPPQTETFPGTCALSHHSLSQLGTSLSSDTPNLFPPQDICTCCSSAAWASSHRSGLYSHGTTLWALFDHHCSYSYCISLPEVRQSIFCPLVSSCSSICLIVSYLSPPLDCKLSNADTCSSLFLAISTVPTAVYS